MQLPRETFVSHFKPVFQVHCLKLWPKRARQPPEALPRALHEWIKTSNGRLDLDLAAFRLIVEPAIDALYRTGNGARPTPEDFTVAVYDVLTAAGVEVTLGPVLRGHG